MKLADYITAYKYPIKSKIELVEEFKPRRRRACRDKDAVIGYAEVNSPRLSENYWHGTACCTVDFLRS